MSAPATDILLVEDDTAIRESLSECLELAGHAVRAAAGGPEALAWLSEGNLPRVVLLDLIMPGMSGDEVIEELRAAPSTRDLPVVLMTAAAPGEVRSRADALLAKPFELADLLAVLRGFLERRP